MQTVVHFAFPRDYSSLGIAKLFEYRNAEGAPEQVSVGFVQRGILQGSEHNDGGSETGE